MPDLKAERPPQQKPPEKKAGSGVVSRFLLWGASLSALGLLAGAALFVALLFYFGRGLPDYRALATYEPPIVTRAYAVDGRLLAEFAAEKRIFVPVKGVPPLVIDAFLSAEDKNFYTHPGIDFTGIVRAILTNVKNIGSGARPVGASTITQQVAKNFLLTNETTYERKVKEAILSFRIEQALSKDRILELYLNEIFLGARAYGVAAASLEYFNKPLEELTLEEAAFLAALPKAPNNYNPERHYEAAIGRRNWVIDQMLDNGKITRDEADAAKKKPITLVKRDGNQYVNHPYFAEEVRRKLLELYGEKGLYEGGLIAQTTMIPEYQQAAEKAFRAGLIEYDQRRGLHTDRIGEVSLENWQQELGRIGPPAGAGDFELAVVLNARDKSAEIGFKDGRRGLITYNKMKWASRKGQTPAKASDLLRNGQVWLVQDAGEKEGGKNVYWLRQIPKVQGGLIAMDPHTGRIFALVGGFSYQMSQFNRATQAIRQPGSAFKPFVYLAGLQAGFTPATLILDAPFVFDQGPGLAKWRPSNYHADEYNGPTTLRVGLERSYNLMTIRLANYVGMEKIADLCRQFGIIDNLPPMLSMAIGAGDTTLLRMVTGYSVFVNGGKKILPTLINRIQDRNGRTIYVHDRRPCEGCGPLVPWNGQKTPELPDTREQIADPRYMYQIVSMLEGAVQRGTGTALKALNRPVAGKTGTTNDSKDVWFIGFTPDVIVGVYVGHDEPRSLGNKETGGRIAAPIVRDFMAEALKNTPPALFRVPPGIRLVSVDARTGTRAGGGEGTILEAFIPGTEPGDEPMMFTGEGVSTVSDVTNVGEGATTGLGGLY